MPLKKVRFTSYIVMELSYYLILNTSNWHMKKLNLINLDKIREFNISYVPMYFKRTYTAISSILSVLI